MNQPPKQHHDASKDGGFKAVLLFMAGLLLLSWLSASVETAKIEEERRIDEAALAQIAATASPKTPAAAAPAPALVAKTSAPDARDRDRSARGRPDARLLPVGASAPSAVEAAPAVQAAQPAPPAK